MKMPNGISRRELLQNTGTVAAAAALGGFEALAASRPSAARSGQAGGGALPQTLALIGDSNHNQDYIRVSLDRLFKELGLPIDYTTNYQNLSRRLLDHYQLFIGFRDNSSGGYGGVPPDDGYPYQVFLQNSGDLPPATQQGAWITEEQGQAVKEFVEAGNGFYSLHNNAFVSRSSKNYRDVQGGLALGHPSLRPFKVRIVNKDHPVTQGVQDFMVTDEQHYAIYDKDPKNILLQGENIDGLTFPGHGNDLPHFYQEGVDYRQALGRGGGRGAAARGGQNPAPEGRGAVSISGWAHEYGQGRVVFTGIGHTIHAMWRPEYLKLQKNAVRWLLKMT